MTTLARLVRTLWRGFLVLDEAVTLLVQALYLQAVLLVGAIGLVCLFTVAVVLVLWFVFGIAWGWDPIAVQPPAVLPRGPRACL